MSEEAPAETEGAAVEPAPEEPAENPPAEGEEEAKPEEGAEGEDKKEGEEGGEAAEGDAGGGEKKEPPDTGVGDRIKKDPHELDFLVPLPEKIEFHMIPKINEARSVWRIGMRKLEETFAEHIANMHLDFEDKAQKYEYIQHQVETNLKFLEQFYLDMQNKMNEKYALIKIERDAWELEKEEIKSLVKIDSEVVSLNIGGNVHI